MSPAIIVSVIAGYFLLLILVARFTSRGGSNSEFFTGDRSSSWYLVAFGMIGASLSGVTFVSVTGGVSSGAFTYMQMVFGYIIGYLLIAYVLMPLYYRLELVSIYQYLAQRFGKMSYRVGAFYFLLSRVFGSSVRLLLVALILHEFLLGPEGIPFWVTVTISVLLIWVYTSRGGIRTIVFTDALQTLFLIVAAVVAFIAIGSAMDMGVAELTSNIMDSDVSKTWVTEDNLAGNVWWKRVLAGALIAFCMTGLDQDMMQKNLTCRTLKDAQKNMLSFTVVLTVVNFFFLLLGGALSLYMAHKGMEIPVVDGKDRTDLIFPMIALESGLPLVVGVFFMIGLVAAAYSSADSALTSLTTSVCVDFLDVENKAEAEARKTRRIVHILVSVAMIITALVLNEVLDQSALWDIFFLAGLTYGPLFGLFVFGLVSNRQMKYDKLVIIPCIIAPVATYFLSEYSVDILNGYAFGPEIVAVNGLLTMAGLYFLTESPKYREQA